MYALPGYASSWELQYLATDNMKVAWAEFLSLGMAAKLLFDAKNSLT
jgi:hypothetical protein